MKYPDDFINKIICGDCLKVMKNIPDNVVDLVVADPPFNKGKDYGEEVDDNLEIDEYYKWCQEWIKESFRILKDTGSLYVYTNSEHIGKFQTMMKNYGIWQNTLVWHYTNPVPDKKRFPKSWSAFLFFTKTDNYYFYSDAEKVAPHYTSKKSQLLQEKVKVSDVWSDISKLTGGFLAQKEVILKSGTHKRVFVYQLPIGLIKRIVKFSSKKDDIIVDLFSHSATTSYVTKHMNRRYIAMDKNPDYCKVASKRLAQETLL